MRQILRSIAVAIAVGLISLAIACGDTTTTVSSAYVTASSVEDLVGRSSLVVIGTVASTGPERREIPGRLPSDPTQIDPNYTGVGQIYEIEVERYLKGTGGTTIRVVQFEGSIVSLGGQVREIQSESAGHPLTSATRYLLFLIPQGQVDDLWLGTAQPFRFALSSGLAKAESPEGGIPDLFPNRSESTLISEVETILTRG